ncbi:hypothetical protein E2C01_078472 [Portunus trituberculatus]|uniref:Uncharacterized protein n=1 Tax=Portunus trituberculatus TaxID=210409 RepID=A0A5B7IQ90_PORTR|nr:hypothetical protein [Portunus trituberculatus]
MPWVRRRPSKATKQCSVGNGARRNPLPPRPGFTEPDDLETRQHLPCADDAKVESITLYSSQLARFICLLGNVASY